jgi:hypothetical protein
VVVRDILIVFLALVPENWGQKKRLRIFRQKSQNFILFYLISWPVPEVNWINISLQ